MQIVICDDIKADCDVLRDYIAGYACEEVLDYVIEEFSNAESLLAEMEGGRLRPDILFMDIYLEGMTGMEAAKLLKAAGFSGAVIFITTSESHAVESYRIMANGYLVKPYTKEEFNRNFRHVLGCYAESFKAVSFLSDRLEFRVFLKDLEYVEAAARGSLLHAKGETISTTKPLVDFVGELTEEDCFLRCHRGCIVNLNYVARVEDDYILMKSGAKAPLALRNRQAVRKAATDFFFLKMREEK